MILHYVSSNGNDFDLKVGRLRMRSADFHAYRWEPMTVEQKYGSKVYRFDKTALTYTAQLSVFGTMDEKRTYLNLLHAAFDHDIYNMTPGKIVHGEYSIECYIIASNTYYENPFIYNDLSIYCPYPFWMIQKKYELRAQDADEYEYLDFPYGFPYDYKATLPGYTVVENHGEAPANYQLTIYGPAINPIITIGDMPIGVKATIGSSERVVISSTDKTVTLYGAVTKNLFNARLKGQSMFNRIPPGGNTVLWSGSFNADLILYEERSEPLWI